MDGSGAGTAWQLRQEVFWLFLSPWNGILRLNRGDQAVEHLFHMTSVQAAVIPHGAASLIIGFDRKKEKKKMPFLSLFFTPLCGGVKWMIRAAQKRKKRKNGRY